MEDEWRTDDLAPQEDLKITPQDIDVDVTEGVNEVPMDEGEEAETHDPEEEFQDDSIAAFYSHRKSVFCVALHPKFPNPPLSVSGGEDDAAWIWNTIDGTEVAHLTGHADSVIAVAFSHDGEMVATGGLDGRVRLWRRHGSGHEWFHWEFLTNLEGPSEIVWLTWHPRGPVLVAGSSDTTIWMWKLPSGAEMNVFNGHTGSVTCGRFTPDGRKLVTGSDDGSLIVWDPATAAPLAKLKDTDARFALDGGITSLCISPDNKLVVVGGAAGGVRVVSIANIDNGAPAQVVAALDGHDEGESIETVEFIDLVPANTPGTFAGPTSRTSTHVVTACTDGRVIAWDLTQGKMRGEARHESAVTKLIVHPNTPLFTTSSMDHRLRTWDARTMQLLATQHGFTDGVLDVAVGIDDGITQGMESGGIGAYVDPSQSKGYKLIGAGDEGVALVFRLQ
ncbi:60S ribosomal subunit assembly or modification protein [Malassezia pachydermatis]|uniref:Wd40 repeat-like protein n=1 Tax=Malassezia pachydermatis TaxID=77020 RepID=A0A0M8MRF3_9BASI|nr:wd40 repeat-like protein [Malassezia pachydermatis]KOS12824.1 wd40 repeat-like protein [Malassezia pachydermatis]